MQTIQKAPAKLANTASAIAPALRTKNKGQPREAGFVVFKDRYTTQAALQMLQYPSGKYNRFVFLSCPCLFSFKHLFSKQNVDRASSGARANILAERRLTMECSTNGEATQCFLHNNSMLFLVYSDGLLVFLDRDKLLERTFAEVGRMD